MRALELQEFAKKNGFDSVKFKFTTRMGDKFTGKFIDAYFGIVGIPKIKGGFVVISQLRQILGEEQEYEVKP